MAHTIEEWLEADADRAMSRQRAQADAAKLVATFVVGIVATLVATSFQVGSPLSDNRWEAVLLAASVILTAMVVFLDRISEADRNAILAEAQVRHWDKQELLTELRMNLIAASKDNQKVLREVRICLFIQFLVAISCGLTAVIAMLHQS